jgi:hypothetical protein
MLPPTLLSGLLEITPPPREGGATSGEFRTQYLSKTKDNLAKTASRVHYHYHHHHFKNLLSSYFIEDVC